MQFHQVQVEVLPLCCSVTKWKYPCVTKVTHSLVADRQAAEVTEKTAPAVLSAAPRHGEPRSAPQNMLL